MQPTDAAAAAVAAAAMCPKAAPPLTLAAALTPSPEQNSPARAHPASVSTPALRSPGCVQSHSPAQESAAHSRSQEPARPMSLAEAVTAALERNSPDRTLAASVSMPAEQSPAGSAESDRSAHAAAAAAKTPSPETRAPQSMAEAVTAALERNSPTRAGSLSMPAERSPAESAGSDSPAQTAAAMTLGHESRAPQSMAEAVTAALERNSPAQATLASDSRLAQTAAAETCTSISPKAALLQSMAAAVTASLERNSPAGVLPASFSMAKGLLAAKALTPSRFPLLPALPQSSLAEKLAAVESVPDMAFPAPGTAARTSCSVRFAEPGSACEVVGERTCMLVARCAGLQKLCLLPLTYPPTWSNQQPLHPS